MLKLTLPKADPAKARRIKIRTQSSTGSPSVVGFDKRGGVRGVRCRCVDWDKPPAP